MTQTTTDPIDVSFKAAWDVWREDTRFAELAPELRAAIRCGFVAGWQARGAVR